MVKDNLSRPSELYPGKQVTKYFLNTNCECLSKIGPVESKISYSGHLTLVLNKDGKKRVVLKKDFKFWMVAVSWQNAKACVNPIVLTRTFFDPV